MLLGQWVVSPETWTEQERRDNTHRHHHWNILEQFVGIQKFLGLPSLQKCICDIFGEICVGIRSKLEISDGGRTFLPARKAREISERISGQISEQISGNISETSFKISRLFRKLRSAEGVHPKISFQANGRYKIPLRLWQHYHLRTPATARPSPRPSPFQESTWSWFLVIFGRFWWLLTVLTTQTSKKSTRNQESPRQTKPRKGQTAQTKSS